MCRYRYICIYIYTGKYVSTGNEQGYAVISTVVDKYIYGKYSKMYMAGGLSSVIVVQSSER